MLATRARMAAAGGDSGVQVVDDLAVSSATDTATYTFSNVALTGSWTHLLMGVTFRSASVSAPTITGVTVEGNAATERVELSSGGMFAAAAIYVKEDSTPTPDIVASPSNSGGSCTVGIVAVTGLESTTVVDTATSTADPANLGVDTAAGGIVIGCSIGNGAGTAVWAGAIEFYDLTLDGSWPHSGAYELTPTAETPRSLSVNWTGPSIFTSVAASFR